MIAPLACAVLLGGCSLGTAPEGPYAKWLRRDESVQGVTQAGPFTILDVTWRESGPSFMGSALPDTYQRVLWRGKVLVHWARLLERQDMGNGRTLLVVLANKDDRLSGRALLIVDERPDGTVLHRPRTTDPDWSEDPEYSIGTAIDRRTRYFTPTDGHFNFLLDLETLAVTKIPKVERTVAGPYVTEYAGMSPDGTAVAYASSGIDPSALVVIDLAGSQRDVIPIPQAILDKDPQRDLGRFSPLLRWFAANRVWKKNGAGQWDTQPAAPTSPPANPVEELYLDANGYHTCFAPANDACVRGWRKATEAEDDALFNGYRHRYAYVPERPLQAFGGNVTALWLHRATVENGYTLLSELPPERLASELVARLKKRGIPFVDTAQCPDIQRSTSGCQDLLGQKFGWQGQFAPYIAQAIQPDEGATVLVTPTGAFAISARAGGSYLSTTMRYGRSGPIVHR